MKKLQSAFGMILMFFGGIGAVSIFLSFFRMVTSGDMDLPPLGRFALWAVMLAFAAGVCWLGHRLYVKGGKSIRFSAKKADKREKTRETPKRAKPAKKPAAQETDPVFDVTVDGSFVLYLDDKAREKAWYEYETPVIRKIYAEVREGVPAVSCEGYLHHEIGNGRVCLMDDPADIMRKFKRAVTDSDSGDGCVRYDQKNKPGVANLMQIYSACTGRTYSEIEAEFAHSGYGVFKNAVGESVVETLRPIREEANRILSDKAYIRGIYAEGAKKASYIAGKTLRKVYRKVGLVEKPF